MWILTALHDRGVDVAVKPCIECGKANWMVVDELHVVPIIDVKPKGRAHDVRSDIARAFLLVECRNCGFTKFHDVGQLGYTAQLP
jgi:predicted nucleic-acid-binding Zn-ribbon protein